MIKTPVVLLMIFILTLVIHASEQRIQKYKQNTKCEFVVWQKNHQNRYIPYALKWKPDVNSDTKKGSFFDYPNLDSIQVTLTMVDFTNDGYDDFVFNIKGNDTLFNLKRSIYFAVQYDDSLQQFERIKISSDFNDQTNSLGQNNPKNLVASSSLGENTDKSIKRLRIQTIKDSISTTVDEDVNLSNYKVTYFPNPASTTLNIKIENYNEINSLDKSRILLVDQLGKTRQELQILPNIFPDYKIDITDLESGAYSILLLNNNNQVQVDKLIIER